MGISRNRVIYNSEAVFRGPSPATGSHFDGGQDNYGQGAIASQLNSGNSLITGLIRVQDISYGFNIPRKDVNQFGELAAIDRIPLEGPTVNLTTRYLVNSLFNERMLGFTLASSSTPNITCISGFLTNVGDDRNLFVRTFKEGQDAQNNTDRSVNVYTYAFGNCFINNYSVQGSVGNFIEANVSYEALNFKIDSPTGNIPAIIPTNGNTITNVNYDIPNAVSNGSGAASTTSVLRPGDINISLGTYGTAANGEPGPSITDWKAQSFNLAVPITRTPLLKLGSKYAFSRVINFPLTATASFTAKVGDLTTGNLADFIGVDTNYNLQIDITSPGTGPTSANKIITYKLLNAKLDSQSYTSSIGQDKSVSLAFSSQIAGPSATGAGIILSGTA